MKRVTIRIQKLNRQFKYEFPNLVSRDEVLVKLFHAVPGYKTMVDEGRLDGIVDFYLTWEDLGNQHEDGFEPGEPIDYDEVLAAETVVETAPEAPAAPEVETDEQRFPQATSDAPVETHTDNEGDPQTDAR